MIADYKKHSINIPNVYRVMTADNRYMGLIMCETKSDYNKMVEKWGEKSYIIDDWSIETFSEMLSILTNIKKPNIFNKYHIDMLNLINLSIKKKQYSDNSIDIENMTPSNLSNLKTVLENHGYKVTKTRKTKVTKKEGDC